MDIVGSPVLAGAFTTLGMAGGATAMNVLGWPVLIEVALVIGAIVAFTRLGRKTLGWTLLAFAVILPLLGLAFLLAFGGSLV